VIFLRSVILPALTIVILPTKLFAQTLVDASIFVCTNKCMVYMQGAPRPVLDCPVGQQVKGNADSDKKYLVWKSGKGTL